MRLSLLKSVRHYFVFIFFLICTNACISEPDKVNEEGVTTVVKKISVSNPADVALKVTNVSNSEISYYLELNGNPKYDITELADYVKATPNEAEGEPLERKAWRYVRDNLKFNPAFSEDKWQHNPHLLVNSLGFGQCDDHATLLVQLWKELGYEARIWGLEGHVVSEVKRNDKWQMYDAAYGVYYFNKDMEVAGVQELAANTNLIKYPSEIAPFKELNDYYSQFARYSSATANTYATRGNNAVSDWFIEDELEIDPEIIVPAHTTFHFPIVGNFRQLDVLYNSSGTNRSFVEYGVVTIPKQITGKVKLPFVIADVKGEGLIKLNRKTYNIEELNEGLFRKTFNSELNVKENLNGIKITYYLTPSIFKIEKSNELKIKTNRPEYILIDTMLEVEMPKQLMIKPIVNETVAKQNYKHFTQKKQYWQEQLSKIETIQELKEVISIYYQTQESLSSNEQKYQIERMNEKIDLLIEANPENENLVLQICKKSDLVYFINMAESNEVEDVLRFWEIMKKHIEK